MDKVIFEVEISNNGPRGWETAAVLELPATWAEFHDALQKARIEDGRFCRNELLHIRDSGFPDSVIGQDVNLYDLNLFAQRLAALNDTQGMGMKALLEMERHDGPIPLNYLIHLTYNTDTCRLMPQLSDDRELGAFLYENRLLSDEAMALLDKAEPDSGFQSKLLALLGEQHRQDHGGVFTRWGYAEIHGEMREMDEPEKAAVLHRPGAPVILEVTKGWSGDLKRDDTNSVLLSLPAPDDEIRRAIGGIGTACAFRCVDCRIPSLREAIDDENDIRQVNQFARKLAQKEEGWGEGELVTYKALLEASGCVDLQDAARLMEGLEEYELLPDVILAWDYAERALRENYPDLREALFRTDSSAEIGRKLLEDGNAALTEYGLLQKRDGSPLPCFVEGQTDPVIEMNL